MTDVNPVTYVMFYVRRKVFGEVVSIAEGHVPWS